MCFHGVNPTSILILTVTLQSRCYLIDVDAKTERLCHTAIRAVPKAIANWWVE